jgi:hypothetical protein
MENNLATFLADISVGPEQFYKNMAVFPLLANHGAQVEFHECPAKLLHGWNFAYLLASFCHSEGAKRPKNLRGASGIPVCQKTCGKNHIIREEFICHRF